MDDPPSYLSNHGLFSDYYLTQRLAESLPLAPDDSRDTAAYVADSRSHQVAALWAANCPSMGANEASVVQDAAPVNTELAAGSPLPAEQWHAGGDTGSNLRDLVLGISDGLVTVVSFGTLFQEYVRLLPLPKPRGFLFENGGINDADGGNDWRLIQSAFREEGYCIHSRLLRQLRNCATSYYLPDGLGNICTLAGSSGTLTSDRCQYDACGSLLPGSVTTTQNACRYKGQQFDQATGLHNLRIRYYTC